MGISTHPLLVLDLKSMVENEEMIKERKMLELKKRIVKGRRARRIFIMKRRANLEGSRRPANGGIGKRVRTLKRLIPNGEEMGLEGLFMETADYILSLEMRVRVMQIMVDVLTNGSD